MKIFLVSIIILAFASQVFAGDPIHGVDVKLGAVKPAIGSAQGDPIHGIDVKLGVIYDIRFENQS